MTVSILVLVDLAHEFIFFLGQPLALPVSILVLVDLAHELSMLKSLCFQAWSFNPCFSGSCSRIQDGPSDPSEQLVSILVLVDLAHEYLKNVQF